MSKTTEANQLGSKHYVTLLVRLLIDQQGQLHHGMVVGLRGKEVGKFRQLTELPTVVADWLTDWTQGQESADTSDQY